MWIRRQTEEFRDAIWLMPGDSFDVHNPGCTDSTPASPQFEVASVRPVSKDEMATGSLRMLRHFMRDTLQPSDIPVTGDRVSLKDWTLVDLIAAAYSVNPNRVYGPGWLSDQEFDVEAKVPVGTPKENLNAMLQSLLEERFGLKAHKDSKTGQGFALVVDKDGPKLTLAAPPPLPVEGLTDEERKALVEQKIRASMEARRRAQEAHPSPPLNSWWRASMTMEELATKLEKPAGAPVVDDTGLTGKYSVKIEWSIDPGNPDFPGGTIFDAVEKLGLKLEPRKVTVGIVVVDHVAKTPTEN
jgi:uncharacterized protein (TIGR03435 family)